MIVKGSVEINYVLDEFGLFHWNEFEIYSHDTRGCWRFGLLDPIGQRILWKSVRVADRVHMQRL